MDNNYNNGNYNNMQSYNNPSSNVDMTPISMWGYFGYEILYSIPCIGFIFLVINAISAKNVNVKNFARSYFCLLVVVLVLCAVIYLIAGASVLGAYASSY